MPFTYIQMSELKKTSAELEAMLYDIAVRSGIFVPLNRTTFKYKKYIILKGPDNQWHVFLITGTKKKHIATTFLKVSSFAICKAHEKNKAQKIDDVLNYDGIFKRNYIDSQFFRRTYQVTTDNIVKDNALWRYEVVHQKAKDAKLRIDDIFYSSIA